METLARVVQHPLFGITSLIVGVLSLVLAYVFYRLSGRTKEPRWAINSNNLISGFSKKLPNLDIKYSGKNVENLTISRLMFWNAGTETIDQTDIADADPVRIVPVGQTKILDVELLKANSEPSRFLISRAPDGAAHLEFDFLDKDQGAVVQVIHTGTSSKDIVLTGTIKGAGSPMRKDVKIVKSRVNLIAENLYPATAGLVCLYFSVRYFRDYLDGKDAPVIAALYFLGFIIFGLPLYRNVTVARVPKGLEIYGEGL